MHRFNDLAIHGLLFFKKYVIQNISDRINLASSLPHLA